MGDAEDTNGFSSKVWAEGQQTQTYTSKQARKRGWGAGGGTGWKKEGVRRGRRERRKIELNWECPKGKPIKTRKG